jgi:16S rRNA (guanine966-N2)-methyltransferase
MRIIGGKFKNSKLKCPPQTITRPTTDRVREAIFNILCHASGFSIADACVMDVFAGSGALGIEALSRGAAQVNFVESHPFALQVLSDNIAKLSLQEQCRVYSIDVKRLPKAFQPANLIFMDPPYHQGLELPTLEILRNKGWIGPDTWIVLETAKENNISFNEKNFLIKTLRTYGSTSIYIVMPEQ